MLERSWRPERPPAEVWTKAKLMLLDTIGCILAGRLSGEMRSLERAFAAIDGGPFRFPGGAPLSTQAAAAVGAIASTWDEGCEGLAYAHGRPALPVVGALLPLAIARDATLASVLQSLIAGYEIGARAGGWLRIRPGMHVDGNWPALGVAVSVAKLLGLDLLQATPAIDIAACQLPASLYLPIATGDNARNTYIAHSAWLGVLAAFSAAAGITAPRDALPHYAENYARAAEGVAPADKWYLLDAYFKLHACVRHAHYAIEAARQLPIPSEGIQSIHLRIYEEAATYAGNRAPRAPIQAQFSLSFGVAAALRFGGLEADTYRVPKFDDAELRRLEALVQIEPDPSIRGRAALLTVRTSGGDYTASCDRVPGDAGMPNEPAQIMAKFLRYSKETVSQDKAAAFADALMNEKDARFTALWARLT